MSKRNPLQVLTALAVALTLPMLVGAQGRGPGAGGGGGPYGGGGSGGGGGDEGFGNNLSVPAVFVEGYGVTGLPVTVPYGTGLRPTAADVSPTVLEYWDPLTLYSGYYQQQTVSHWQAQWRAGIPGTPEPVIVNWSDNLTHQYWTAKSTIRVETVLYQNPLDTMQAYEMAYLFGKGSSEMWGTSATTIMQTYRTAYSVCARLTIQKLVARGGAVDTRVPPFSEAIYESFGIDGPGGYSAEVNVSGNLIYGFNWTLRQWPIDTALKTGWWRLTFSLDPVCAWEVAAEEGGTPTPYTTNNNTALAGLDEGDLLAEVYFKPTLPNPTTSVLEIEVLERRTGRKPANPGGEARVR